MMAPIEFVLVAVIVFKNPTSQALELDYMPLDHFRSMQSCIVERNRLQKKVMDNVKTYICLRVDYD